MLAGCSAQPRIPPHRLVSDNPCVDAILADVATPAQIGAVSAYSQDPRATSVPLAWAQRFPAVSGTAEEIVAARPTRYLTGSPMNPATQIAAQKAGVRALALPVPNSVAESVAQVRQVAAVLGRSAQGEALVARMTAAATPLPPLHRRALIYQGGGLVLGPGTLADDLLRRAGFDNAASQFGGRPWDVIPLERVLSAPPDIILAPQTARGEEARGLTQLRAALRGKVRVAAFDPQLLYCGARSIIGASARLRAIRGA